MINKIRLGVLILADSTYQGTTKPAVITRGEVEKRCII